MNFLKRLLLPTLVLGAAFFVTSAARADHMGTVTYTGPGIGGTFTFTYNSTGYIYAISGTVDGSTISALLPGSDGGSELFYANSPNPFDYSGLSFELADGQMINLAYAYGYNLEENFTGSAVDNPVTYTSITFTPEPSSWMLLGTGLLGFALVARRRVQIF